MRQLLMSVMLIIVVVAIYSRTVKGDDGTEERIQSSGTRIAEQISRISP